MTKKMHSWTDDDEQKLMEAIKDCEPLFDHYKNQGVSYSEMNAWDAIAGRLLPDICVTGAACRKRFDQIKSRETTGNGWEDVVTRVAEYERDLAETTFDGVSELLGNFDVLFDVVKQIKKDVDVLKKAWE